jgi:hypothetical protein
MGCLKLHTEKKYTALKVVYRKGGVEEENGVGENILSGFAAGAVSSLVSSAVGSIKGFQIKDAAGNVNRSLPSGQSSNDCQWWFKWRNLICYCRRQLLGRHAAGVDYGWFEPCYEPFG